MDGVTWERHANPWSAWTRLPVLPLLAPAVREVIAGLVLVLGAKLWFLDRMVRLFDGMARSHEEYSPWLQ